MPKNNSKPLMVYNSLTDKKEEFTPINKGNVGMYVCGPTVYSESHIGNLRTFVVFDLIIRFLKSQGYKVRYIRNITDVGHLEDDGEDRIAKKAKLENVEPMEIATRYTNDFKEQLRQLNCLHPDIEPLASGHIVEQIQSIEKIIAKGYAYEAKGSVYFDIDKFRKSYTYGKLSNRNIDDLISNTRELKSQKDKKNSFDFALWKKADSKHIMKWSSPWGDGFPGWHLECTTMSQKYLGENFDIHGGGMDLKFPHHDCEIAQSEAIYGNQPANYWIHTNMLTSNKKKMSKSTGNILLLTDLINDGYFANAIRLFLLSAHYRSVLDFNKKALDDANSLASRFFDTYHNLNIIDIELKSNELNDVNNKKPQISRKELENIDVDCKNALLDDFNTPKFISELIKLSKTIDKIVNKKLNINKGNLEYLNEIFMKHLDILGFDLLDQYMLYSQIERESKFGLQFSMEKSGELLDIIEKIRSKARAIADYDTSDFIRDELSKLGYEIQDKD